MGVACSTYGGEKRNEYRGSVKERVYLEDVSIDGKHDINVTFKEVGWESMGWINLAQDTKNWRDVLVKTVVKFLVS
jgi:hypothetical protein